MRRLFLLFTFAAAALASDLTDKRQPWDAVKLASFNQGDATDRSWAAQTPTVVGNASFSSRVANFDGSGDAVRYGDIDALSFTDGAGTDRPFSISVWVKFTSVTTCDFAIKGTTGSFEYQFGVGATSRAYCGLYNPTASAYIDRRGSTLLSTGTWYHLVVTYSGSEAGSGINQYFNGVLDNGATTSGGGYTGMTNGTGSLSCGMNNLGSNALNGSMDDFKIFASELTANEIGALYASEVGDARP